MERFGKRVKLSEMVQRANRWIQRNIFYVTAIFAMLLSVTIGAVFYGIHLGSTERNEHKDEIVDSVHVTDSIGKVERDSLIKNANQLIELINKK